MAAEIGSLVGTIHASDSGDALSQQAIEGIVQRVLAAIDDRSRRTAQASSDTKVTPGVAHEQEHDQ